MATTRVLSAFLILFVVFYWLGSVPLVAGSGSSSQNGLIEAVATNPISANSTSFPSATASPSPLTYLSVETVSNETVSEQTGFSPEGSGTAETSLETSVKSDFSQDTSRHSTNSQTTASDSWIKFIFFAALIFGFLFLVIASTIGVRKCRKRLSRRMYGKLEVVDEDDDDDDGVLHLEDFTEPEDLELQDL